MKQPFRSIFKYAPSSPYLNPQVWGSCVFFRVAMVCGTNVQQTERSGKMRNCHRAATGFVVKKQLSLAAGEWLAGHSMLCMAAFRVAVLNP